MGGFGASPAVRSDETDDRQVGLSEFTAVDRRCLFLAGSPRGLLRRSAPESRLASVGRAWEKWISRAGIVPRHLQVTVPSCCEKPMKS